MPNGALLLKGALVAVALTVTGSLWAEPIGYSVNSRGNERDDQRVNALWRINLSTGQADYVGWTSFIDLEALAFSPDNQLFGADDDSNTLVRVSTTTGLAQPVGGAANRHNTGLVPLDRKLDFGMNFTCDGELFVVSDVERSLFRGNLETGALTLVGSRGALGAPITDIAVRGDEVFGIGVGLDTAGLSAAPNLYRIDLQAPSAEVIGPLGPAAAPYNNAGLSFDAQGNLWAITDRRAVGGQDLPSQILRISPDTGEAVLVAQTIVGLESLAIGPPIDCARGDDEPQATPIPVLAWPGQLIFILGLLALASWSFRRRFA